MAGELSAKEDEFMLTPLVLADAKCDLDLLREDVFGPIVSLVPVESMEEALVLDTDVRIRGAGMRNMFHEASAMHGGFRKMIGDWLETMDFEEAVRLKWQRVRSFMYANGMEKFPTMAQLIEAGHEDIIR